MSWGSDDYSAPKPAGKYMKVEDGDDIEIVVLSEAVARFRPAYGSDDQVEYYPEHVPGCSIRVAFDVYNLDERRVQMWETSTNNQRMINDAIRTALSKRRAPTFDRLLVGVKRSKGANGFVQYTIMGKRSLSDAEYTDIQQQYSASGGYIDELEGAMPLEVAVRKSKGGSGMDPSPPPAAQDDDASVPF